MLADIFLYTGETITVLRRGHYCLCKNNYKVEQQLEDS